MRLYTGSVMKFLVGVLLLLGAGSSTLFAGDYETSVLQDRRAKDRDIRLDLIGPFTAIGQASLRTGKALRVAVRPDTLLLDTPTADVGIPTLEVTWKKEEGAVYLRIPMGGQFMLGRNRIGPVPTTMAPGDTLRAGRFLIQVYRGATSARIMAFDPARASRMNFKGLHYFEPDEAWKVEALVETISDPDTVTMTTSLGLSKHYLQHSRLHFMTPQGTEQSATLFVPLNGAQYGFLPFTDVTSGEESYGAGRYLDVDPPAPGQESMVLDFNMAYNPYCAYTNHYNCPIPPAENQLTVAVEAGEKRYK
ncbi:DUF1684 domain-containing protein [bacterium]|nr:DUF1684 domain-containing protein [bacterium]